MHHERKTPEFQTKEDLQTKRTRLLGGARTSYKQAQSVTHDHDNHHHPDHKRVR